MRREAGARPLSAPAPAWRAHWTKSNGRRRLRFATRASYHQGVERSRARAGRALILVAVGIIAVAVPAALGAARTTTAPGIPAHLFMTETDRTITFDVPRNAVLLRGVVVSFVVTNRGRTPHRFAIMGHSTATIPPGKTRRTSFVIFDTRGRFLFYDPLHRISRTLRGYLTIQ